MDPVPRRTALFSLASLPILIAMARGKEPGVAGSAWTNQLTNLIILSEEAGGYSGFFGYSPAPGAGNLVISITAAAGTDPSGNAYLQGLTTYEVIDGTAPGQILAMNIFDAQISLWFAGTYAGPFTEYAVIGLGINIVDSVPSGSITLNAIGPGGQIQLEAEGGAFINGNPIT